MLTSMFDYFYAALRRASEQLSRSVDQIDTREEIAIHAGITRLLLESGRHLDSSRGEADLTSARRDLGPAAAVKDEANLGVIFHYALGRSDPAATRKAAATLSTRFRNNGQYFGTVDSANLLAAATLLNTPLLFHADQISPDHETRRRATQHGLVSIRFLQRGDGSVAEAAQFDATSGAFVRPVSRDALRQDSSSSIVIAQAMRGWIESHEIKPDRRFLLAAERAAEFYLLHTPPGAAPAWDYEAPLDGPNTRTRQDLFAAVLASTSLLKLADLCSDRIRALAYRDQAMSTLETLSKIAIESDHPTSLGMLNWNPSQTHPDADTLSWADLFFVEALVLATKE